MQDPSRQDADTPLAALDRIDRDRWKRVIAAIWLRESSPELLELVVGGGEATFLRKCQIEYAAHKMDRSDFEFVFRQIRKAVEQRAKAPSRQVMRG